VATAFTARARPQGVSAAIVAKTQTSLCQYQMQHSKPDCEDCQITESVIQAHSKLTFAY